ncbi:uncharacterized protein BDV17DRAFT_253373 [Aspergillus undulatus]|uniref:uncharacterized protein n=1 Tax=Aspergillus undulatus TaxID=1810928 RepID=UPI003CCDD2ED
MGSIYRSLPPVVAKASEKPARPPDQLHQEHNIQPDPSSVDGHRRHLTPRSSLASTYGLPSVGYPLIRDCICTMTGCAGNP